MSSGEQAGPAFAVSLLQSVAEVLGQKSMSEVGIQTAEYDGSPLSLALQKLEETYLKQSQVTLCLHHPISHLVYIALPCPELVLSCSSLHLPCYCHDISVPLSMPLGCHAPAGDVHLSATLDFVCVFNSLFQSVPLSGGNAHFHQNTGTNAMVSNLHTIHACLAKS